MARSNPFANLADLSMRQLRELARTLGIQRYSAQGRDALAGAIADRSGEPASPAAPSPVTATAERPMAAVESEMAPAPRPAAETRVVFLPRDPQWAYVFWDISEDDRSDALHAGASQ
ncbi:DUF4912 domain-containing protein, partial [Synechococcus sp. CCY 9618]|uniref:DUF4912 domain-containing protein n=1 Tax=Synechococcus sp. CCY 9618 TaxID=2815602 RepID=UPI001C22C0AE